MTLHDIVAVKHSWASYNLIYLHAFNRAIALMCTYLHIMVIWSHVAASVWLPLAMPVPHQDTVPLLYDCDNGSIPSTKLPWRPHPGIYSRGPAAPHFSGSFIHEVTSASGTWMEYGGRVSREHPSASVMQLSSLRQKHQWCSVHFVWVKMRFCFKQSPLPRLSFPKTRSILTIKHRLFR